MAATSAKALNFLQPRTSKRNSAAQRIYGGLVVVAVGALVAAACASPPQQDAYNAFLQKIAAECRPLIIGSDDIGQAIVFNGLGALPENYNNFLGKTAALYAGSISRDLYRDTLTSSLGGGSYNARSFNCIFTHLPPVGAKP